MTAKRLKSVVGSIRNSKSVCKNIVQKGKISNRVGFTLLEVMVAIVVIVVGVMGTAGYRYHSVLAARKADVQVTAARIASMLLQNWKGSGGHSGYSKYEFDDLTDSGDDPCDYDLDYDYDTYNPDDYDYDLDDSNDLVLVGPGMNIYYNAPGPDVPAGFSALDTESYPNYKIVVNGINYYATLSYKDEVGEPRVLNVCVAWMNDYQTWTNSDSYQSLTLTTYADD